MVPGLDDSFLYRHSGLTGGTGVRENNVRPGHDGAGTDHSTRVVPLSLSCDRWPDSAEGPLGSDLRLDDDDDFPHGPYRIPPAGWGTPMLASSKKETIVLSSSLMFFSVVIDVDDLCRFSVRVC